MSVVELSLSNNISPPDEILVGKDILELVSGAMYVDPLNLFREYVQNATDSIDQCGLQTNAQIDISLNPTARSITIRDNGAGLPNSQFTTTMTAIGGSQKRAIPGSRGFRGVGRLAGLGYCRTLSFRSKAKNDREEYQIVWDCVRFKKILRDTSYTGNLGDVIKQVTAITTTAVDDESAYFEITLDKVVRLKNDILLNGPAVRNYLSQVAPVPFHPEFYFSEEITARLSEHGIRSGYTIMLVDHNLLQDEAEAIYRPHRNEFTAAGNQLDEIGEIEYYELFGVNGDLAAIGWVAETSYYGAIPPSELLKGIRFRMGNIQVGESNIVAQEFPETRFNSWCIGELHVLSRKVVPNGRRDNFEENAHFENLLSQLQPHLKNIAQLCRSKSSKRQWIARFSSKVNSVKQDLVVLGSGSLTKEKRAEMIEDVAGGISTLEEQVANSAYDWVKELGAKITPLKSQLTKISNRNFNAYSEPLSAISVQKRRAYQEVLELIYEVSSSKESGNLMIKKLIKRLASKYC